MFRRLAIACMLVVACRRSPDPAGAPLRIGFLPNITHAQALVGGVEGIFAQALSQPVKMVAFNSGPLAIEALASGSIDASYVGAGPAVIAFKRTHELRVVSGVAAGGAVFVSRTASGPEQLHHKKIAAPMIGNTQDIALRTWMRKNGLKPSDRGGDVFVYPLSNSDIGAMFQRNELEAAWVPEPWGARLVAMGGHILVDERTLWPGGRAPSTVLVVSRAALERRRPDVTRLVEANAELTREWANNPNDFARRANAAYANFVGRALPEPVLRDAFSRLIPTTDPMEPELKQVAVHAALLDYIPDPELEGIVVSAVD